MSKRRSFLKLAGGGVILAAAGSAGFVATRTPTKALAPWQDAGSPNYKDPRMRALSYAILAPNPHNRQPWLVEMEGDSALTLSFDQSRQLPHTDPFDRQLTIGLGCFLELMTMAANADQYAVVVTLFPDGSDPKTLADVAVARVEFVKDESVRADPLWPQVLNRRSNKEPYDTALAVSERDLDEIVNVGANGTVLGGSVAQDDIDLWRKLTEQALRIEIETPRTYKESVDLFRIGKKEIEANPDGIDFSGAKFEALSMAGMFTREVALDRESSAYIQGIDVVLESTRTAMGHVWMVTEQNRRRDQIAAGADWLRVNLATTALGLGFQPLSQPLQEYAEMQDLYQQTQQILAPQGGTVQMLARIGYGPSLSASPRWPVESRLI